MRNWICALLWCAAASTLALSQAAPKWVSHRVDGEAGEVFDELLLQGTYIKPPNNITAQPSLIVRCEKGKVIQTFFSFGAVLSQSVGGLHPVRLEAEIDKYHRVIEVDNVSPDWTAAYLSRKDLGRMLQAKIVKIGAVEFAGPVIQAEFDMPNPDPVYSACGKDASLKPDQPF
ncbi:MAG TPA: hypothetical protein VLZ50_04715 [Terracidiphilus sp.]|nr:hypothetical protein [Terracidiphilus sp.]